MPELPEVETVCRGLAKVMEGHRLLAVVQRRADLRFPFPDRFAERLTGRRIIQLRRRAKFIIAETDGPDCLMLHLGMSGRFTIQTEAAAHVPGQFVHDVGGISAHDHVAFDLTGGCRVVYNDPRRFGYMDLVPLASIETSKHFAHLGPEPLGPGFDAAHIAATAASRRQDLKAFLLDQRNVAGLGNIYVCEALFRAGLSPRRQAATLADRNGRPTLRCARLVAAIRSVLDEAIAAGGSSLRDYARADGSLGYFQHAFAVYDRAGAPCSTPGCTGIVRRIVQSARSTFHCPRCQR